MPQVLTKSMFEKLGGKPAIEAVVNAFYELVLSDDQLKGYFGNTDMGRQRVQQVKFLTMALGGPNEYDGKPMKEAHEGMHITEHHFNLVAGHLVAALKGAGVGDDDVNEVVSLVAPLKDQIVTV